MSIAATEANRRRFPRRQPALGTVCRIEPAPGQQELRLGLVWNISLGGISLLFNEELKPGETLRADLATEFGPAPLPIGLRVCHISRLVTGDYIVGCQFERPLTPDELRPFIAESPDNV